MQISLSARAQGSQYTDRQSVASTDSRTILTNAKSDSTSLQLMDAPTISPTASDTSEGPRHSYHYTEGAMRRRGKTSSPREGSEESSGVYYDAKPSF